jgi:hypothetical protein
METCWQSAYNEAQRCERAVMMSLHRRFACRCAAVVTVAALTACGGSSSNANNSSASSASSSSALAAFCAGIAEIKASTQGDNSASDFLAKMQQNVSKVDALGKAAPSNLKDDMQKLVDAIHKALQTGDATAFGSDAQLEAASKRIDAACGLNTGSAAPPATGATPGGGGSGGAPPATSGAGGGGSGGAPPATSGAGGGGGGGGGAPPPAPGPTAGAN